MKKESDKEDDKGTQDQIKNFLTSVDKAYRLYTETINIANFLLFRAVEIQRICEAAATPTRWEGASLSE